MYGYNIILKLGSTPKQIVAVTQDDFSVSAVMKESITKDDLGQTKRTVTGHDATFTVAGLATNDAGSLVRLTRDDILDMSLKKGSEAIIAFQYLFEGGATVSGNAIITGYNESATASVDQDPTFGLNLQTTGDITYAAASQSNP